MRYLLVLGFTCDVYRREPRARIFVGDKLIDEYYIKNFKDFLLTEENNLQKSVHKLQPISRDKIDNIFFKNLPPLHFYEIDIKNKKDKLNIRIEIDNEDSNYSNGFLSKSTLLKIKVFYFFPLNKELIKLLGKILKKKITSKYYAYIKNQKSLLFNLTANGLEWHGKDKKIINSTYNLLIHNVSIGGSGHFTCDLEKKYGIYIKKNKKSHIYMFSIIYLNYFINKYEQHANQRNSD